MSPRLRGVNRGVSGLAVAAAALLIVQVLAGGITVRVELPAGTVVLHLAFTSGLLAVLLIAGLRALTEAPAVCDTSTTYPRWALACAVLGFVALLFGGWWRTQAPHFGGRCPLGISGGVEHPGHSAPSLGADNAGHPPAVTLPAVGCLGYSSLRSSTRRFCARPSGVALLATGSSGP